MKNKTKTICAAVLAAAILLTVNMAGFTFSTSAAEDEFYAEPMIVTGEGYILALKTDGTVWAWGGGWEGCLGYGGYDYKCVPIQVKDLTNVTMIAAGNFHNLAVKNDGTVWAWGSNEWDQLGDGTNVDNRNAPVQVKNLTDAVAVAAGTRHSIALKSDGTVWAWGDNGCGQLGDGLWTHNRTLVQVKNLTGVKSIAAGNGYSLALKNDGTIWSWGGGWSGNLGNGEHDDKNTAVQVLNLTGADSISVLYNDTSLAFRNSDSSVWVWGNGLGVDFGGAEWDWNSNIPVKQPNLTGVTAIARGESHHLILKSDGTVWAWGNNDCGQIGDPMGASWRDEPIHAGNMTGVSAIAAIGHSSIAVKNDGTIWAWGGNWGGELGNGTFGGDINEIPGQVIDGNGGFFNLTKRPAKMTGIKVASNPYKLTYNAGEYLDIAGLVVKADYDDGSDTVISGYTLNPANGAKLSATGTVTITATYQGFAASFTVTVKEAETTAKPPVTTTNPPVTTANPPVTTTNPPETTAKPVETTAKPPATTVKPFEKTTKKPPE
ncbi:MAG: bacterial Ig-like domain-containing protein, partial [Oscillospiraceae bacterium]|nr:bacterial Ig-like domain-containing protein [Oscillospiraceae bacterium]